MVNLDGHVWTVTRCAAAWHPSKPDTAFAFIKNDKGLKSKVETESLRWDGTVWQVVA